MEFETARLQARMLFGAYRIRGAIRDRPRPFEECAPGFCRRSPARHPAEETIANFGLDILGFATSAAIGRLICKLSGRWRMSTRAAARVNFRSAATATK
jgi:hypothetical protein